MMTVKIAAASAVETATAPNGMPAADRIAGLTKTMYAIVRNVTKPPSTSLRTVDPRLRISKYRSSLDSPEAMVAMGAHATPGSGVRHSSRRLRIAHVAHYLRPACGPL